MDTDVGVAVDVYHLWWDPFLKAEIGRAVDKAHAQLEDEHALVAEVDSKTTNARELLGRATTAIDEIIG